VIIAPILENQILRRPFAPLFALFAIAALALALGVSPASAEVPEGLNTAPAPAAAVAVEEASETAAGTAEAADIAEAPTPSPEPQTVETTEAADVVEAAQASVAPVADEPVASASSGAPVSTSSLDTVRRSATEIAASASNGTSSVGTAEVEPETVIAPAAKHDAPTVTESIRRNSSEQIANVRHSSTKTIASLADRIPDAPAAPSPSSLLDLPDPASVEGPLSPGPSQAGQETPRDGALGSPQIKVGSFLRWTPLAAIRNIGEALGLVDLDDVAGLDARPDSAKILERAFPAAAVHTGADPGRGTPRPEGRAPLDLPLPIPDSPAAIAPGSGDAFFVPFAALLALLALVAPASTRRFREAPEFPAPIPFVCALERPG